MADNTNPGQDQTDTGQTSGDGQTAKPGGNGKTDLSTLPEDVKVYIQSLRDEAKGYRTERDDARKSLEDMTAERDEAQAANRDLSESASKASRALTLRSLRDEFDLDEKAEKFLTATSEEELREQAEALAAFTTNKREGAESGQEEKSSGGARHVDPAQEGQGQVDEDQVRAEAFFQ